jgi:hypothetical protein
MCSVHEVLGKREYGQIFPLGGSTLGIKCLKIQKRKSQQPPLEVTAERLLENLTLASQFSSFYSLDPRN